MRTFSDEKPDDLDLDLPALDGEEEAESDVAHDIPDFHDDGGDAFDDSTGEDAPVGDLHVVEGAEGGWLVDAENANTLDVGVFDVAIEPEGKVLVDDEADTKSGLEDLVSSDENFESDSGEEGPLDDDEELREEDLPSLDADEDGDVPDEDLYDRTVIDDDLRWDDRAWSRVAELAVAAPPGQDDAEDSGILAVPGEDPTQSARDAAWRKLDEGGRVMAATFVPGGSVVVAIPTADRSRAMIVRIQPDGESRIIAEVDPNADRRAGAEDEGEACVVTFLRWDAARGCLFVGGSFGVEAYKPAV